MRGKVTLTLVLGMALAFGVVTIAPATERITTCPLGQSTNAATGGCPPQFFLGVGVEPVTLPKRKMAPISIRFDGALEAIAGVQPPVLKEVVVDFDKNGTLDAAGLPVCRRSQLETLGFKTVRRICRKSRVGSGKAHIAIGSSEQEPLSLTLTLFNGGVKNGTTTLFIQSYLPGPTPTPIVAAVKLRRINEGRFGMQGVSKVPPILDGRGSLLNFSFVIKQLFKSEGAAHSYVTARCFDSHLGAKATSVFADGTELVSKPVRPCTPKG